MRFQSRGKCPLSNSRPPSPRLAVLLVILVLSHEARHTIRVGNSHGGIAKGERRAAAGLGVVCRLELLEAGAAGEVVRKGDVGGQVGARVEGAGALAAVEMGDEGVLVDPVGAGEGARQALGDAVAGAFDAVFEVEVDLGDDAGHVDALVIADAAGLVLGDLEVGESSGGDFGFADGAVAGEVLVICFEVCLRVDELTIACQSP